MKLKQVFLFIILITGVFNLGYSTEYKLKNGVTVVYEHIPNTQIVSVQAWVKTGSVNETPANNGISHFLEHILFKGTKNYKPDEIDVVVESCGGIMNAGTSKDYTTYYITLPEEFSETAYKVLADMIFNATFPEDEIDKEKPVVVQEIQRKFDNPTYDMWKETIASLLNDTPYRMEIIGTEENVNSFNSKILRQYYESHYHPTNTTLVVVGDINEEKVRALAEKYFDLKVDSKPAQGYDKKWLPSLKENSSKIFKKEVSQDYVLISYQVDATAASAPVYEVLSEIMSGGEYSMLNSILKHQKMMVTAVSAGESLSKNSGVFYIHMVTPPGESDAAVKELDKILKSIVKNKVSDYDLQKAKNRLKSRTIFQKEKASSLAYEIGYSYTLGIKGYYKEYTSLIDKITADDVRKVANSIFLSPKLIYKTIPVEGNEK